MLNAAEPPIMQLLDLISSFSTSTSPHGRLETPVSCAARQDKDHQKVTEFHEKFEKAGFYVP